MHGRINAPCLDYNINTGSIESIITSDIKKSSKLLSDSDLLELKLDLEELQELCIMTI